MVIGGGLQRLTGSCINTDLVELPLGRLLPPAVLPGLLLGPRLVLHQVPLHHRRRPALLQLGQHLPPGLLTGLVLVADGVRVHLRADKVRERFVLQLGHLGHPQEGETFGHSAEVQVWGVGSI